MRVTFIATLFCVSGLVLGVMGAIMLLEFASPRQPVSDEVPANFPVLVITPGAGGGRQNIKVECRSQFDDHYIGWYVARKDAFEPLYDRSFYTGDRYALNGAVYGFAANVVLWVGGWMIYRKVRRLKPVPDSPN